MFGLFKKKKKIPKSSDKVWMSEQYRVEGFVNDLKSFTSQGERVYIFYFFRDSKRDVQKILTDANLPYSELDSSHGSDYIILVSAFDFLMSDRSQRAVKKYINDEKSTVIFAEHYPVYSREEEVFEMLGSLTERRLTIEFYVSLEGPLMQKFGSDRIVELMKRMGSTEQEFINHSMISSAINNAQKKIERDVEQEYKVDSAEEWFKRNTEAN